MRLASDILVSPVLSERASAGIEKKKYTFRVAKEATKVEIKNAVEELYKVDVDKVNTIIMPSKYKRVRMKYGYTKEWKKAIVTLKKGEIDFYKTKK